MMKKALCLILTLAMILSLAACGGGSASATPDSSPASASTADSAPAVQPNSGEITELTIWGHQEEAWNISYEKIAEDFMKDNPDIRIKYEFFPYDDFESKVQTSLMSKSSDADVYGQRDPQRRLSKHLRCPGV